MAVNGIEIKVGQKWRSQGGGAAEIAAVNGDYEVDGAAYPVTDTLGCRYMADGRFLVWTKDHRDLIELIEDAPGAEPAPAAIEAPTTASAPELLQRAAQHMTDRAATYDQPEGERSMGKTVAAFNAVTGRNLTEAEGWLLLDILKQVRLFQRPGYHADSAEDHIAYAALMAEAKSKEAV